MNKIRDVDVKLLIDEVRHLVENEEQSSVERMAAMRDVMLKALRRLPKKKRDQFHNLCVDLFSETLKIITRRR